MPLSSPFKKLKSHLRDKLHFNSKKDKKRDVSVREDHDIPTQQVPEKNHYRTISPAAIPDATVEVCSTVNIALQNVIDAQSGAATTASVAQWTALRISELLRRFTMAIDRGVDNICSGYRELQWGSNQPHTRRLRDAKLRETIDPIIDRHACVATYNFSVFVADEAGIYCDGAREEATRIALEYFARDVMDVVIKVVRAHVDAIEPDTTSVTFIKDFSRAITGAASQTASMVAKNYGLGKPPPYCP